MTDASEQQIARIGVRLIDDAYTTWRAAEMEAGAALRSWFDGYWRDRDAMWLTYRAALDREEAAARDLERLSELAAPCVDLLATV